MSQSRFALIPTDAICDTDLTPTQLRVLCAIGSFTSRKQTAYPSRRTIAAMLGIAKATVSRCVSALAEKGYIEVTRQFRKNGSQTTNLYFVPLDRSIIQDVAGGGDARITPPVTLGSPLGVTAGDHPHTKQPILTIERVSALNDIFNEMIRAGAPVPSVKALSRAVVNYEGCSMSVNSRWECDRAMQDLEQYLKRAGIKLQVKK